MDRNDSAKGLRLKRARIGQGKFPRGTAKRPKRAAKRLKGNAKHPLVALPLASGRIMLLALRHGAKPLRVDYRTGDVWLDSG